MIRHILRYINDLGCLWENSAIKMLGLTESRSTSLCRSLRPVVCLPDHDLCLPVYPSVLYVGLSGWLCLSVPVSHYPPSIHIPTITIRYKGNPPVIPASLSCHCNVRTGNLSFIPFDLFRMNCWRCERILHIHQIYMSSRYQTIS